MEWIGLAVAVVVVVVALGWLCTLRVPSTMIAKMTRRQRRG